MEDGLQRWTVGDVGITGICEEQTDHIPPELFFPEATAEAVATHEWLVPDHADEHGNVSLRIQAFVVEVGNRTVVVDPCVGNGRQRMLPFWTDGAWPWMERFEGAGFGVGAVDHVVHTHLHADHVGWGTRRDEDADTWVPTFGRARYLYTERALAFARDPGNFEPNVWLDSVAPVLDAGLGEVVEEDADLGHGLRLESTTGHTPGHVSLWIESAGEVAMISGDWLHHPVQLAEPSWSEVGDSDAEQARETRARMLAQLGASGALLLGTHFGAPSGGRVVPDDGGRYRLAPV